MTAKPRSNERPADIEFWLKDGMCVPYPARVEADAETWRIPCGGLASS
jgi:hypothetical protein